MQDNKVALTPQIKARFFEYSLLSSHLSKCNEMLAKLAKDFTEEFSPIDSRYLESFFNDSLANDNFDGIAYLVNYCDRYNVDISRFPIHRFHSAIDYYLNKKFDLSKIMIFTKFYKKYYSDRADRELDTFEREGDELTEAEIFTISKRVFGKNEDLVDMKSLTEYLVKSLG